jgi:SAM-dependent methyltransferase
VRLLDLVGRALPPGPWAEGEKIPWHEPAFSARMLREHLSQAHDGASRRTHLVEAQVAWIHAELLGGRPTRVLDLGCGPGLYTARLAALGHRCVGVDVAPAAIDYARAQAAAAGLACTYRLADVRNGEHGRGFGLAMMLFGEINVFRPADARLVLAGARAALADGGLLLLEAHTAAAVRRMGEAAPTWRTHAEGLFSPRPHLRLDEAFWDEAARAATHRYFVVDAGTGAVERHAESVQAYSAEAYRALLGETGFALRRIAPSLDGGSDEGDFLVLVGETR